MTKIVPVYNLEGKEVEKIELNPLVFDGKIHQPSLYQAVVVFRTNQRKGLASTKTRGEVSGGGKKPWRQKGTGRARHGSIRSPLWRHGGVVFGPHPRDFSLTLPKKIKLLALKSALNVKLSENEILIIKDFNLAQPKTKEAYKIFLNLNLNSNSKKKKMIKTLLLLEEIKENVKRALNNLDFLNFVKASDVCAYHILAHKKLILTKEALKIVSERILKK